MDFLKWFFESVFTPLITGLVATVITFTINWWLNQGKSSREKLRIKKPLLAILGGSIALLIVGYIFFNLIDSSSQNSAGNTTSVDSTALELQQKMDAARNQMHELHAEVYTLRVKFETYNLPEDSASPNSEGLKAIVLQEIREESDDLIFSLLQVNESFLSPGFAILKYDHLTYVMTIAAEVETLNEDRKRDLVQRALNTSETLLYRIKEAQYREKDGENKFKGMSQWIQENRTRDRIYTLRAWLYAISALIDSSVTKEEITAVQRELDRVSPEYRLKYPLIRNPSLKHFN